MIFIRKLHKLILLILFLIVPHVAFAGTKATSVLDKKITVAFFDKPLSSVLKSIEKQADVNFVYVSGLFNADRHVTISVRNATIKAVARRLIPEKNIEFYAKGKNIVLCKKGKAQATNKILHLQKPFVEASVEQPRPMKAKLQPYKPKIDTFPSEHKITPLIVRDTITIIKHDTLKNIVSSKNKKQQPILPAVPVEKEPSVQKPVLSKKWSVGIWAGPDIASENLSQNHINTVFGDVKQGEQIKSSLEVGLWLEYKLNAHWGVQTGLGYTSKKWAVKYKYQVITTDYSQITGYDESNDWDKNGMQIITRTPIYETDTTNVNYSKNNIAHYLMVPIQLNYYYPVLKHFELKLGVNTSLMLLCTTQGKIKVTDDEQPESLNPYLKDYYLRLSALVGLNYLINDANVIGLQTAYGSNITPIFKNIYPINRSEGIFSITLSYSWRF